MSGFCDLAFGAGGSEIEYVATNVRTDKMAKSILEHFVITGVAVEWCVVNLGEYMFA